MRSKPPNGGSVVAEEDLMPLGEETTNESPAPPRENILCVDNPQRLCSASRLEKGEDSVFTWTQPASELHVQMHGEMHIWGHTQHTHTHTCTVRATKLEEHSPNCHVVTVGRGA